MKNLIGLLVILLSVVNTSVSAALYKHTDQDGVTTYSDFEVEGAIEVKPPRGNTIMLPKYSPSNTDTEQEPEVYSQFSIVSPENDATIWENSGNMTVTLSLTPELKIDDGDNITVYLDDQVVVSKSTSLAIKLTNIDRGSHSISAEVKDSEDQSLIQSNNITVHIKRFSKLN